MLDESTLVGRASECAELNAAFVEAVRGGLEAVARRQPAVVFLDDLQWADNATLELLPLLADSLTQCPLLILSAY